MATMTIEENPETGPELPNRRNVLRLIAATGATIAAAGTIGAGTASADDDNADTIMIIRHGEKPDGSGTPYGITENGEQSDGSLTVRGWVRAGALVALFAPTTGDIPRPGLLRPAQLFSAYPRGDKGQRPLQTITPLAAELGQTVNIQFTKGDEAALAAALVGTSGVSLVSWAHEAITDIVANMGTISPAPPSHWPDDRFDLVWIFTRTGDGWAFSQVAQMLLSGDRPDLPSADM